MIVWDALLDNKYECSVTRNQKEDYSGTFKIKLNDKLLFEKEVPLSYGAVFGADYDDILKWQTMALDYVDSIKG